MALPTAFGGRKSMIQTQKGELTPLASLFTKREGLGQRQYLIGPYPFGKTLDRTYRAFSKGRDMALSLLITAPPQTGSACRPVRDRR
jgi:hypothetical protein